MLIRLFFLFVILPLLELYILMKLGAIFGVGKTFLFVIGTGILGGFLAKWAGLKVLFKVQEELEQGRFPAEQLIDGFLIFVAGVLLILPGVITDVVGIFILFPLTRTLCKQWLVRKFTRMMKQGHTSFKYIMID
jgi:UPF0716 protein FxsA